MTPLFLRATEFVLEVEGGYVNDPRDPGGETAFGLSKRSYPNLNMRTITKEDAIAIYHRDFWLAYRCQEMPPAVGFIFYDACINQGPMAATLDLQKAAHVAQDGVIGPQTLGAVRAADPRELLARVIAARGVRYAFTRNLSTFAEGWYLRLARASLFAFHLLPGEQ